ncbi:CoA-binding protein [Caldicellulosiruptor naganoensis]|uniref:CoA-binding protein n=1 Tax=Caldicellulosiruptor naganoensis TaxID=29324 RepID=A0ABY7BKI6_9FIRM|nr:CoA-binding protein [Caldicellulosiruptor naganoensis]WAM32591.1 CoA-binding protein [Caldicellulosiruptor naganoensis]
MGGGGATPNKEKYGYLVFKRLLEKGYNVFAVNPFYSDIEGNKVYKSLEEVPHKIECVSMIVSPKKGEKYIKEAASIGVEYIWFQPGADDVRLINMCKELGIVPINDACVLVALNSLKR